jgi:hypothetical protein
LKRQTHFSSKTNFAPLPCSHYLLHRCCLFDRFVFTCVYYAHSFASECANFRSKHSRQLRSDKVSLSPCGSPLLRSSHRTNTSVCSSAICMLTRHTSPARFISPSTSAHHFFLSCGCMRREWAKHSCRNVTCLFSRCARFRLDQVKLAVSFFFIRNVVFFCASSGRHTVHTRQFQYCCASACYCNWGLVSMSHDI